MRAFVVAACLLAAGAYALDPAPSAAASTTLETVVSKATAGAVTPKVEAADVADPAYWLANIAHQGYAAFNANPAGYKVFRNVMDYGAKGDGVTDDTAAINAAISDGNRCAPGVCQSATDSPAVVYFPAGTYLVSTPVVPYYLTQLIGNPNSRPVLKATAGFTGLGVIDADPYQSGGAQGWASVNIFMRQIRNFVIDLTNIPPQTAATGIHWPTAQATSLQNIKVIMTQSSSSQQQGIFVENGSAGFMTDIETVGGLYGLNIGNQQYTIRNVVISGAVTGISQIWDWGWLWQGLTISNCGTAFDMTAGGSTNLGVGSVVIIDSTISNTPVGILQAWSTSSNPSAAGQLILENVVLNNVPVAVKDSTTGATVLSGGSTTIVAWGEGNRYTPDGPNKWQGAITPANRPASLLNGKNIYTKSKPQYESLAATSFLSVRAAGAKGDGVTDDTTAIQNAITSAISQNKVLFFDFGYYKVTNTIYVPAGARMVGETYSIILATGSTFGNINNPVPVIQIGKSGESGSIEWSDMVVSTQGSTPGAVLIEWNLAAASGSGMWDVHTRIGGFKGSNLQVAQCPKNAAPTANCEAAYMSIHFTKSASGAYLENNWFWTADHDMDDWNSTQISVFTGRGLLNEGTNTWLWGVGVEHHGLYQFQFNGAKNVFAGFIQTETPYWQPVPNAINQPYPLSTALNDPNYASACLAGNCDALGLRLVDSSALLLYGVGLYSFFNDYSTDCSKLPSSGGTANCQSEIFSIEGSTSGVTIYSLSTIGSTSMITINGASHAKWSDNESVFPDTIALFTYQV